MIDTSSVTQQKSLPLAPQRPSAGDNSRYTTATMIHLRLGFWCYREPTQSGRDTAAATAMRRLARTNGLPVFPYY